MLLESKNYAGLQFYDSLDTVWCFLNLQMLNQFFAANIENFKSFAICQCVSLVRINFSGAFLVKINFNGYSH